MKRALTIIIFVLSLILAACAYDINLTDDILRTDISSNGSSSTFIGIVRAELEPSCGYYIISYDFMDNDNEYYFVKLTPYMGNHEIKEPQYVTGEGVTSATPDLKNKQIFWNPFLEGVEKGNWQFRITATSANMVLVKGGSFMMGSNGDFDNEKPIHQVTVSDFMISKYQVTQKEWKRVMGNNPSYYKGDNRPVENVSWYDAVAYCNKRSIKEGLTPCYSGHGKIINCNWEANGYRLPTEAEWEYAARGGTKSKGYEYSGSNDLGSVACYWHDSVNYNNRTDPVGIKQANELGLYDMSGNVWEWCWDLYDRAYYAKSQGSDPKGAGSGSYRVLRGGSWNSFTVSCRVAYRFIYNPINRRNNIGFRVSRAIK